MTKAETFLVAFLLGVLFCAVFVAVSVWRGF
jgi:hypothetical protein